MSESAGTIRDSITTGVFTAGGVDPPGSSADTLIFPGRTFKVATPAGTGTPYPKTCLLNISMKGTCKIDGGTGTCTAISGHGTDQLSTLGTAARSAGKCTQNGPPVTYQQIVHGSGPVHLKRHTVRVLPRVPATGAAQARPVPHPHPQIIQICAAISGALDKQSRRQAATRAAPRQG